MVFNWFKRKFADNEDNGNTKDDTEDVLVVDGDASVEAVADEQETEDDNPEDDSAEDYLAWAQAALDNLQGQEEAVEPAPSEPSPEVVEAKTEPPEPLAPPTPDVAVVEDVVEDTDKDIIEDVAPVQAEETVALEVDEPQAAAPAVRSDADAETEAGFRWSAEVLAAQGRNVEEVAEEELTWLTKLRKGLGKTRRGFVNQLKSVVGQGPLTQEAIEEIETLLLQADVGIEATDIIVESLQQKVKADALPAEEAIAYLKEILRNMLDRPFQEGYDESFAPTKNQLNIWLMAGVNGVGKTTTIGKLTNIATSSGYACLIAAADTFRAAAVQQVKVWGERSNVEVICNPGQNTDPAAVVFDAIASAQSRKTELLLVDTAGRLQNKKNLMEELAKVRRIIAKKAPDARVESLLVLDATLGQNGLRQAQVFSEAAQLTGVVLTKLDGTAKGGVALGVVQQLGLPIRFIGAGEGIEDLRPFSSYEFVEALLSAE